MSESTGTGTLPDASPEAGPVAVRALTLFLYWGSLAIGVLLPPTTYLGVEVLLRKGTFAGHIDGYFVRLFSPEDSDIFLILLGALPFAAFAVFALLHLGTAPRRGALVTRRRRMALLLALATMVAVSGWGHLAILTAKGSTAAIGFLFLPIYVGLASVVAYGSGRLIGRWRIRE